MQDQFVLCTCMHMMKRGSKAPAAVPPEPHATAMSETSASSFCVEHCSMISATASWIHECEGGDKGIAIKT